MTVADVLDTMSLLDNENDFSSGGAEEARGIVALNVAQRYFEMLVAGTPRALQTATTITQAAATETTEFSSTLKRIDAVWALDDTTLRPTYRIKRLNDTGAHIPSLPWPLQLSYPTGQGPAAGYYANSSAFYWLPLPDGTHSIRIYGFVTFNALASRVSPFFYTDAADAMAAFASKLLSKSVGDTAEEMATLANSLFRPVLKMMQSFDRSEPMPRMYAHFHDT